MQDHGSTYWRSLAARDGGDAVAESFADREFQEGASELELDPVGRRRFMGLLGAGAGLAGVGATAGCVRKPVENILPFAQRPEDMVEGKPVQYATAYELGGTVTGVLVTSFDGRPIKVEGNPNHPGSRGATSVFAQASVLDMYEPSRSQTARKAGQDATLDEAKAALGELAKKIREKSGQGTAVCVRCPNSPSLRAQLRALKQACPQVRLVLCDPVAPASARAAAELLAGKGARTRHELEQAKVIFAADSDFLGIDTDQVRLMGQWAKNRRVAKGSDAMARLYAIEPHFTGTGSSADHRLRLRASQVGEFLLALLGELRKLGVDLPAGGASTVQEPGQLDLDAKGRKFLEVLAKDLREAAGASAIVVGDRQPAWVHGVGLLIDTALRNAGGSLRWRTEADALELDGPDELAAGLSGGQIDTVVCLGTNPAYESPGELGMKALLAKATVVHAGTLVDETAAGAAWHVPVSHYLEAWGDLESSDGTITICQPLIDPLYGTPSVLEIASVLASGNWVDGYSLLKGFWMGRSGGSLDDRAWRRWLHDGVVEAGGGEAPAAAPDFSRLADAVAAGPRGSNEGFEVDLHLDPKLLDGRFSTNGWMQELPHPMTKLTWDNAAYLGEGTAKELGVENGDFVDVTVGGRTLRIPVWIAPGQAPKTVSIALGYGRAGVAEITEGAGFDAGVLAAAKSPAFAVGNVTKAAGRYELVSTQDHGTMKPPTYAGLDYPERPIALEASKKAFTSEPAFVEKANLMKRDRLQHLWDPPKLEGKQQWGMTIDLGTCTGCNACVIACQAENNIPVVGKERVANGREMHWIRIDRYYRGDGDDPTAIVQPMTCQQCESAPCETVCPVAATTHSPEGLNDMAYNRCIGTRYCSNNCPYKVRRFNFFNYNMEKDPVAMMRANPNVTVRFRGVMEKCTYCVQRINMAKIDAHVAGQDKVADGGIVVACEQACPASAITFGDVKDPQSRVSRLKALDHNYAVLRDLNTHPRTTYLARIRNPHPELA